MNVTISCDVGDLDLVHILPDLGHALQVHVLTHVPAQDHVRGPDHDLEAGLQDLEHQDQELRGRGLAHGQGRGRDPDPSQSAGGYHGSIKSVREIITYSASIFIYRETCDSLTGQLYQPIDCHLVALIFPYLAVSRVFAVAESMFE